MGRTRTAVLWLGLGLLVALLGLPSAGHAATARGKVTRVVDGDTFKAKVGRSTRTYHLTGLDSPELRGDAAETCYGRQARSRLARELARNARVTIRTRGRSRRAEVLRGRRNVNRRMVRGGFARALPGGGTLGRRLRGDEAAARTAGRGLWGACAGAPGGGAPQPPGGAQPGDVTGQAAIDQLTAELRDARFQKFRNQGDISDAFQLDLCGDGRFRFRQGTTYQSSFSATEFLGQPWTVVEALIRADGSYRGARVRGTVTEKRSTNGSPEAVNEPVEVRIEQQSGTVYWDGEPAEHIAGAANCAPTV